MQAREETSTVRVAIIGAGIGGLAAAVALQHKGIRTEIYEQAAVLREVGGAIVMRPPSIRLFWEWGIAEQFAQNSVRVHWLEQNFYSGGVMNRMPVPVQTADPTEGWMDITHRADLHSLLLEQLPPDSIHLSSRCGSVIDYGNYAEIRFVDGTRVRADLVIAADGIHSVVRPAISPDRPLHAGRQIYRGMVTCENARGLEGHDTLRIWVDVARDIDCLLLPLRTGKLIAFEIVMRSDDQLRETWSGTFALSEVLEKMSGFEPALLRLISKAEGPILATALFDRDPIARWSTNRMTLLGDAAHPMLPIQGQGANMAIEDAAALAQMLQNVDVEGIPAALQRYEEIQMERTAMYQRLSRQFDRNAIR